MRSRPTASSSSLGRCRTRRRHPAVARHLGRSPSTISREVQRNGGADRYRAAGSDQAAWDRGRRPKLCKLACRPFLRRTVSALLRRQWSPEQIAGWLKRTYPKESEKQVSHETISRSLFIQARGVLKKELLEHLQPLRRRSRTLESSSNRSRRASTVRRPLMERQIGARPQAASAKMTVWNEAMYYFHVVPAFYRKTFFV
jgi:IS30 family transposase